MSVQRRKYDPDFQRNAVRLSEEPGRTATEVAENLDITKDLPQCSDSRKGFLFDVCDSFCFSG